MLVVFKSPSVKWSRSVCTCFVNPAKRVHPLVCCQTEMVNRDVKLTGSTKLNIWVDCHTLTTLHETIATKTWRGKKREEKKRRRQKIKLRRKAGGEWFFFFFSFHKGELISMTTLARDG